MLETTRGWHLYEIPTWHFLMDSPEVLAPVWKDYGVSATHSHEENSIMHTSGTFLIDPLGQKRWYVSTPFSDDTDLSSPLRNYLKTLREHIIWCRQRIDDEEEKESVTNNLGSAG